MLGLNSGLLGVRRVPTTSSASGLWVPNEQVLARRAAIWSGSDTYWNQVSLLLQMQGADGSTTFVDSSTNKLTATVTGDAQISTARYKWGTSSALFDGSGDRISFTFASAVGTSDFCLEGWFYITTLAATTSLMHIGDSATSAGVNFSATTAGRVSVYSGGTINVTGTTQTVPTNAWCHVAITRESNTIRMFVDGVLDGSGTHGGSISGAFLLGQWLDSSAYGGNLNGNIGAARVTVGQARYTATFTPPTAPFPDP